MSISTRMLGFAAFLGVIAVGMTAQSALAAPAVPKVGRYAASYYTPPMPPAFVRIIDNGDSGFSTSKGWVGPYRGQGYGNDVHFTTKGNGSRTAGWTFEDLPAGRYQVAATWSSFKNRATNAPFRILSTSDEGATVRVNQQQRPDDFSADGASWKHLGMLEVTGNGRSIRVILSNDANGFVIADAIRIERVQVSPVCGNGIVEEGEQCDDGNTTNFDGCSHRCDRQTALHCADLIPAQQAAVTHCRNAGFDGICFNAFGGGFQGCVSAARNDCTQNNANASINVLCATGIATSSSAPIVSSFSSSSSTTSRYSSRPYTGEVRIIDNDTEGFSILSGIWGKGVLGYNGGNRWNMAGTGQDRAMWKFHVTPGTYRVSTTWGEHPNRATNTPFRVTDGSRELLSVRVNQEKAPEGLHAHGAVWKYLGTVTVQGDTLTVEISDDADEYVIADAIRIERVLMGPVCGNGLVESYEECDDGNTSDGDACSASCTVGNRERAFRALDVNHDGSITLEEARQRINAAVAALRTEKSAVPEEEWQLVALFDVDQNEVITASDVMTLTIIARLHLPGLVIPACGNGIVEEGEQCDDGNTRNGDFCSASCTLPTMKLCLQHPALYWDQETDTCIADRKACSDPDGGKVYETAAISYGFVTRAKPGPQVRTNGQDLCVSSTKLMEHFCGANDTLESETVDCPHGCRNGACLPPPPPPAGPACGNRQVETGEQCDDGNRTNGDGCSADCGAETMTVCLRNPALYWDQETETCIAEGKACSDPDGGKNYQTVAHAFGFRSINNSPEDARIRTGGRDVCINSTKLMEHFCGTNDTLESETVDCPHGCSDGACLPPPPPPVTVTGNLYVTEGGKPRSRQLLAGTLADSVLRMELRAQHEDIAVTQLTFGVTGEAASVDRFELFRDAETGYFAVASRAGSSVIPGQESFTMFVATVPSGRLSLTGNASPATVTLRPRLLSDEMGGVGGESFTVFLYDARAAGMMSSNALMPNDGDADAEGEVFIGRSDAGPNREIRSNPHDIVLAKFSAITNKLPARPLPIGLDQEIGRFEFTTAMNNNTANGGRNAAKLSDVTFTVAIVNVTIDPASFRWYRTDNPSAKSYCLASMPANNVTYHVTCTNTGALDTSVQSGEAVSFSLEADIEQNAVNPAVDSALQVSITNFSSPTYGSNTHIRWTDEEATYLWIEYPETTIFSTSLNTMATPAITCTDADGGVNYDVKGDTLFSNGARFVEFCAGSSIIEYSCNGNTDITTETYACPHGCSNGACLPPPPPPPPVGPVCGNGQVEAGEQCDDGGTEDGDGCSAQCTTEEPVIHLMSVEVDGANAIVSYGKNFATCGHLRTTGGQLVHTQNVFCGNGASVTVTQPLSQVQVTPGQTVRLCHGNNGNICSLPVIVTGTVLPTESEEDTPGGGLPPAAE